MDSACMGYFWTRLGTLGTRGPIALQAQILHDFGGGTTRRTVGSGVLSGGTTRRTVGSGLLLVELSQGGVCQNRVFLGALYSADWPPDAAIEGAEGLFPE